MNEWGGVTEHLFQAATDYTVDPHGNLFLFTNRCQPVAVFAAGTWKSAVVVPSRGAEVVPNRGADGRFVKRGVA
jgi:hypothetical protein